MASADADSVPVAVAERMDHRVGSEVPRVAKALCSHISS